MADLTDEQCDAFRRLPGSFNDMVRAIYRAGMNAATPPADAALALLDGYMVVRKELTEQMKFNAAFNLSAQFGEDYAMQHKEFAFAVWDEFKEQAEGMLYEPPPALRARAVPEADVRDSLISGCAKPCWCDKCHAAMLAASKAAEGK